MKVSKKVNVKMIAILSVIAMFMLFPMEGFAQNSTNPVQQMFDGIGSTLEPIKSNKGIIMGIVGAIGIILAIIAWGKESSGGDSQLNKVVKGSFIVVCLIEVFIFFL